MENTEIQVQRDWDFDVNLSGLVAPTGKGGNNLPEGYYKSKITDMYVNPDKNPNRVIVKLTVSEGPFTGTIRTDGFNKPTSAEDKVRYYWRALAESVGYGPDALDKGSVSLGVDTFKNKTAHIYFTPKDEERGVQWEDITWLSPTEWDQQKKNFEMQANATLAAAPSAGGAGSALGGSLASAPAVVPATSLAPGNPVVIAAGNSMGGTNATTKGGLLKALGMPS